MNQSDSANPAGDGPEVQQNGVLPPQMALVPQGPGMMTAPNLSGVQTRPDVIRGGMDGTTLFHSFRRRWPLALGLGLVLSAAAGVTLFYMFPESSSALVTFKVDSQQPTVLTKGIADEAHFDTYRKTQIQWLKRSFVLDKAMNSPGVSDSPFFEGIEEEKKTDWLSEQLIVGFPQESEFMTIKLEGTANADEIELVLKAVAKAYYDEVVFAEHTSRLKPREILGVTARKLGDEIKRKAEAYYALVEESGSGRQFEGMDPESNLMMKQLVDALRKKTEAEASLNIEQTSYQVLKRQMNDPNLVDAQVEEILAADLQIAGMRQQLSAYQMEVERLRGIYRHENSKIRAAQAQVAGVSRQIAEYEQQLRASVAGQQADQPNTTLDQARTALEVRSQYYQQQILQAQALMTDLVAKLREKGKVNTDLELRMAELEQLRGVQQRIAERIEQWDIEAEAPMRVQRIPGVEKYPKINTTQRYAIAGLGGIGTFALTCFGIAYLEFRSRKLNGPEEVDEGLGIRVIGTLPSLTGRAKLDPNHPVVAQLTESIDSVRTALMHDSTSSRRQLVMVTSAATMEGRTTVASQLAASLARAGRRTLLIDGDLRRPALHTLFDVPLEDGLCEVLRAETDIADVVRPTHAEGLWLMTAGYCDADAVHALATDQAQPIFEKLRADYDFIIIDGAPVLGLADSLLFGQHCDGAIMSVLRDYTNVPKIHQSAELLRSVGVHLIGAVVNGVPLKADRRVTHLQIAGSKSARKQLENAEA